MNCEKCTIRTGEKVFGCGPLKTDIVIVGEAPGQTEVRTGKPFTGLAGACLDRALGFVGLKREECYVTNALLCHPFNNKTPTTDDVKACRARLKKSIFLREPKVILALGNIAYYSIFPKGVPGGIMSKRGLFYNSDEFGCTVVPSIHPAAILRNPEYYGLLLEDLKRVKSFIANSNDKNPVQKKYRFLATEEEVNNFLDELSEQEAAAYDIETTELDPWTGKILSHAFCFKEKEAYCIFTNEKPGFWEDEKQWLRVRTRIHSTLTSGKPKLIIQNALFEIPFLKVTENVDIRCYFDTLLAAHLINENMKGQYGLKKMATRYPDLINYAKEVDVTALKSLEPVRVMEYTCADVDATFRLYKDFSKTLEEEKLTWLFYNITTPLVYVLSQMKVHGVLIDKHRLGVLRRTYSKKIDTAEGAFEKKHPGINISSPTQLCKLLYEDLKLPVLQKKASGRGSTDAKALVELRGKVHGDVKKTIDIILEHRKLAKLLKTYFLGFEKRINPITGRLHADFFIHGTATGRLSSSNPNMQNVANNSDVKSLIIAPPGSKIANFDHEQLEFRILLNYVSDEKAFDDLRKGFDVHKTVASRVLNKPYDQVTDEERTTAKGVVFGLIYGMATETLAAAYNLPLKEAELFVKRFFSMYPKVKEWRNNLREDLRKTGHTISFYGRKRRLPGIFSSEKDIAARALRQGFNSPIQGAAADVTNFCLIRLYNYFVENKHKARPIMQVHDSIVFEIPDDELEILLPKIKELMIIDIPKIEVPLAVKVKVGQNWSFDEKEDISYSDMEE